MTRALVAPAGRAAEFDPRRQIRSHHGRHDELLGYRRAGHPRGPGPAARDGRFGPPHRPAGRLAQPAGVDGEAHLVLHGGRAGARPPCLSTVPDQATVPGQNILPVPAVGFRRHLRADVVAGDAVYLFSERDVTALQGPGIETLAPLLD